MRPIEYNLRKVHFPLNQDTLANTLTGSMAMPTAEFFEQLRNRLLDLSARNGLLNYRYPRSRHLRFCNQPALDLVFGRLSSPGQQILLKPVPEPDRNLDHHGQKPDATTHAASLGLSVDFDFEGDPYPEVASLQTLLYRSDLGRQLRKMGDLARTFIEETGSNCLFLVFGFLEFYPREDAQRPLMAPLLSLPAALRHGNQDQYNLSRIDEDLVENQTLAEKLRRDFALSLPEWAEEDQPEAYFAKVAQVIQGQPRWRVRRQLTLVLLSFGKLDLWADLDPVRHPRLLDHPLLQSIYAGGDGRLGEFAENYRIDDQPLNAQHLLYDADTSQHSAIIDVRSGKNLVINGPPGTGKSQTITNIIAAALADGKRVLFVAAKLAALEVVRRRLDQAGLGLFCLELHSHTTQPRSILEDIRKRVEEPFSAPVGHDEQLTRLRRLRTTLARYAELMGSRIGNNLGMTIHEIFWAVGRYRQELGEWDMVVDEMTIPGVAEWTRNDVDSRQEKLTELATLHGTIGCFNDQHPWWGFWPRPLVPPDDTRIQNIVREALTWAEQADAAADQLAAWFGPGDQPDVAAASGVLALLERVPDPPDHADPSLLPRMFDPDADPDGERSAHLLARVVADVGEARARLAQAYETLYDGGGIPLDEVVMSETQARARFSPKLVAAPWEEALKGVERLERVVETFRSVAAVAELPFGHLPPSGVSAFLALAEEVAQLDSFPLQDIASRAQAVGEVAERLTAALARVDTILRQYHLPFDGTAAAVAALAASPGLPGRLSGSAIHPQTLAFARRLITFPLAAQPLREIERVGVRLSREVAECRKVLAGCEQAIERCGIPLDATALGVKKAQLLAGVAAGAPSEWLDYRWETLGSPHTANLIEELRDALRIGRENRAALGQRFDLNVLPEPSALQSAVKALRRPGGVLAFFDWERHRAKKLYDGLSRQPGQVDGLEAAEGLSGLLAWMMSQHDFRANPRFRNHFGELFLGFDTEIDPISRLHDWYAASHADLRTVPGLADQVNLSTLAAERIRELADQAGNVARLANIATTVREILGFGIQGSLNGAREQGWTQVFQVIDDVRKNLDKVWSAFAPLVDPDNTSLKEAILLVDARRALDASDDLSLLRRGRDELITAGGEVWDRLLEEAPDPAWSSFLTRIRAQADQARRAAQEAQRFAAPTATLATAVALARARAELDATWSFTTQPTAREQFGDWSGLADAATQAVVMGRRLLNCLAQRAKPGKSMDEVFRASSAEARARELIARITDDEQVARVLGDRFAGLHTDLGSLEATHAWGGSVSALALPSPMRNVLLSADARETLQRMRELCRELVDGAGSSRSGVERLSQFGKLTWEEWQRPVHPADDREFPREIRRRLQTALDGISSLLTWSKYLSCRQQARQEGLTAFVEALESGTIPSSKLVSAFRFAIFQPVGAALYRQYPELANFIGSSHEATAAQYRALDAEIIKMTGRVLACRIKDRHVPPPGQGGARIGDPTEGYLIQHQINSRDRPIPIRQLVKRAGRALLALKPCFMMGPLSVARFLEQGTLDFDLVIMDEASQLRPEEAIGAIVRGQQLVVVGDPCQLPPTTFFDRALDPADDEQDDDEQYAGTEMESILDLCQQVFTPARTLSWHYRSQHESLIAFSNFHFYDNRLIVFPSPFARRSNLGVKYHHVQEGEYAHRRNSPEAARVCAAVLEHMRSCPNESLGVVTLNQPQQERIEELIANKLSNFTEGSDFRDRWEKEGWPFFVKNLENVQGDERDVIFISTTFGRARGANEVQQSFGPINQAHGWRRLNVLFTRAKRRIELFSSLLPGDVLVGDATSRGKKALRDYIAYAKSGILVNIDEGDRPPGSDFEISVSKVVQSLGYEVKPQLGVAGFFIDLAVRNPDRPGEYLAGIECDGASYHSGFSVRDRDRIRQGILESLGWKGRIYRIWSTDWFYNPKSETRRIQAFLEERRLQSQHEAEHGPEEVINSPVGCDTPLSEPVEAAIHPEDDGRIVEVGDLVTYCFVDEPNRSRDVRIVDSPGDPGQGLINKETPLARVLLGMSEGEEDHFTSRGGNSSRQVRVVRIQRTRATPPETDPAAPNDGSVRAIPRFELYDRRVLIARASWNLVRMVVLSGSRARRQVGSLSPALQQQRRDLVRTGVLVADPSDAEYYIFTKDFPFNSPSAASSLIYGRSDNGKLTWRVEGGGDFFRVWEQKFFYDQNPEDF